MKRTAMILGLLGALLVGQVGFFWLHQSRVVIEMRGEWKKAMEQRAQELQALNQQLPTSAQIDAFGGVDWHSLEQDDARQRQVTIVFIASGALGLCSFVLLLLRFSTLAGVILFVAGLATVCVPPLRRFGLVPVSTAAGVLLLIAGFCAMWPAARRSG